VIFEYFLAQHEVLKEELKAKKAAEEEERAKK